MNYTDVFESQGPGLQQVANSLNIMKQDYKGLRVSILTVNHKLHLILKQR